MIVLSRQDCDIKESDAERLMIVLHLKAISEKTEVRYSVVSQMLSPKNRGLAKIANVKDFIISTNLTALILSQISENRSLAAIFEDILDADSIELYMKPAGRYVKPGEPVSMFTGFHAAMLRSKRSICFCAATLADMLREHPSRGVLSFCATSAGKSVPSSPPL